MMPYTLINIRDLESQQPAVMCRMVQHCEQLHATSKLPNMSFMGQPNVKVISATAMFSPDSSSSSNDSKAALLWQ